MADDALPLPPAAALLGTPSHPAPADRASARVLQLGLQHDLPAQWAADKYRQAEKFTGAVAQAIEPYMDAFGGGLVRALRRKPRTVKKASHGSGHYDRDDEFEPLEPDHPLCQILKNPGGEASSWGMGQELAYLILQYFLTGDAPVWMPRNSGGRPVQFYSLTAATVQPQFAGGSADYPNGSYLVTPYAGGATFYAAGMLATGARLPGEEVRFFKRPHPMARNWGMSVLQSAALEIDILEAISRSRWAYFDQALQLDCVVYVPGADEGTLQRLEAEMQQRHGGARRSRKALFIGGAGAIDQAGKPLSVQQLGQGARELDFGSSYEQMAKQIAGFFKVPGLFLGLNESGSSYAADWAAQRRLYDVGLVPAARKLGAFLTQHLARPWQEDGEELVIEVDIAPPQNVESEQAEHQFALQQGVISVNEYRRATNRKAVEGGDEPQPVYIAKKQQEAQPDPAQAGGPPPGSPGGDQAAAPGEGGDGQPDPGDPLKGLLGAKGGPQPPKPPGLKAMSAYADAAGGALVPPPGCPKRKKKRMRQIVATVMKGLD